MITIYTRFKAQITTADELKRIAKSPINCLGWKSSKMVSKIFVGVGLARMFKFFYMSIFIFLFLPLVYFLSALYFIFKKWGSAPARAALYSLGAYGIALGLGTHLILSSRGSTAGIGFLFLPYYALIPALLAGSIPFIRPTWGRILMLIMTLLYYSLIVHQTYLTKQKNKDRDIEAKRLAHEIEKNSQWVSDLETTHPETIAEILTQRAEQTNDRAVLIPIAKSKLISTELLKKLGKNSDLGVVLTVVRNAKTTAETLQDIYINNSYPNYFFSDLSMNPNTPKKVLLELFEKRSENSGIEKGLASNENLPDQLVPKLLASTNALVLGELARNPRMNCEIIKAANKRLEELSPETVFLSTGKGWAQSATERCRDSHF